jgi:hypothetical protein
VQDGYELTKRFLIHILKYLANDIENNIQDVVRAYVIHDQESMDLINNIRNNISVSLPFIIITLNYVI